MFFGNSSYGDKVHVIQTVDPILSIDVRPKNLEFVSAGETKSVFVFTEDSWSATVDVDWVTLSKTEGQGNGEVSVTLGENPEYVQRQTTVVFTSGGNMTAILSISQEALPDPHFLEVSPLSFQFGNEGGVSSVMSSLTAASVLVFSLLYTPCVAAIASIRRELGRGWAWGVVLFQCSVAWVCAVLVHVIGMALGMG